MSTPSYDPRHLGESQQRGHELKCRLVAAALQGCDALWATLPQARMVHTDPLIHVVADVPLDAEVGTDSSSESWAAQAHALAQDAPALMIACGLALRSFD